MRPDEPLDRGRVDPLLEGGAWDEAEALLRALLDDDPQDLSARCRLATLLVLRGWKDEPARRDEAVHLYDGCVAQGWAPALSLNNQGVVWAHDGQGMPAVGNLKQAAQMNGGYGPGLYNLGVLCEAVAAAGGGVPRLLVDLDVIGSDEDPREASRRWFREALRDEAWTADPGVGRGGPRGQEPLHLWREDLNPALCWIPSIDDGHYREAEQQFQEGLRLLAEKDYERARNQFESAVQMVPDFGPRVNPHRIQAVRAHVDVLRRQAREQWRQGRFDEARDTLDGLLGTLPHLPDRVVELQMIADEVTYLSGQLQLLAPGSAPDRLQNLLAPMGRLLDEYQQRHDTIQAWVAARDPAGEHEPVWLRARAPEQLRSEFCAEARGVLRREILHAAAEDAGIAQLLALPGARWLGPEVLDGLAREAYVRLASLRVSHAQQPELETGKRIEALIEARAAAEQGGDAVLVEGIDEMLRSLATRYADVDDTIRAAFEAGDGLRVLRLYAERTRDSRPTPALEAMRAAAWKNQIEALDRALATAAPGGPRWSAAYRIARRLARLSPGNAQAEERLQRARHGWLEERLRLAEQRLQEGDLNGAAARLEKARRVGRDSEALRDFAHRLEEARVRASGEPAREAYTRAVRELSAAVAAQSPCDAFPAYLQMRRYGPGSPRTAEAAAWLYPALLKELEHAGPEALAAIRPALDQQLQRAHDHPDAVELRNLLARVERGAQEEEHALAERRAHAVDDLIARADHATADEPPRFEEALQVLEETRNRRTDRHQKLRIERIRADAVHGMERQFERLVERFTDGDEPGARRLVSVVRPWDRDAAERMRQQLDSLLRVEEPPPDEREMAFRALRSRVEEVRGSPGAALRELLVILREHPELQEDPRVEGLRAGLLARLSPSARLWARLRQRFRS